VSELQGIARIKFHEGKLEEFKRVAAQCIARRTTGTRFARDRPVGTDVLSSASHALVRR
jgi:hypothetical protein